MQLVEALAQDGRVALQGVEFDFNRASLRPDSLPALIAARDAIMTLGGSWRIEGHTDNRGSHAYNQSLSEARALAVRDWLAAAGISGAQLTAEGFSFDRPIADNGTDTGRAMNRRVELVGMATPDMLGLGGPDNLDPCPDTLTPATTATPEGTPPPPAITAWTGTGGQEWLSFSLLMATGHGGETGWHGERISMPPGTQPQTCQALCTKEAQCAAFSFEPAGANFVETASCALIGYGTEVNLRRNNGYLDGGVYYASGLKPDARILTPDAEVMAQEILADMSEIAHLRAQVRIGAPESHASESWMDVTVDGAVPAAKYRSFLEITELDDYAFDWQKSKSALFIHDMPDGRSGQIWAPAPGDYVLRYAIDHPTAGQHVIAEQPLHVRTTEGATPVQAGTSTPLPHIPERHGTIEYRMDRPGADIAATPLDTADPLACQALCAGNPECTAWTYVIAAHQGEQAMCWTKSGVPDAIENPCCVSGVMAHTAASAQSGDQASVSFPDVVEPGAAFGVSYTGPLHPGDWIDMITPGNDDDMSGGWGWAWATGDAVTLTAPASEGTYLLRYVAEDPVRGRIVLASDPLNVRAQAQLPVAPPNIAQRCDGQGFEACELRLEAFDLSFSLMPGYGISEPLAPSTAAGPVPGRPAFELVRLSDGVAIASVNPRQGAPEFCIPALLDQVCPLEMAQGMDGFALMSFAGTLTSIAMVQDAEILPADVALATAGDMQGVWWFSVDMPGTPDHQAYFIVTQLMQDAGDIALDGTFTTAPDIGPLRGLSGDVAGVIAGDTLNLTMAGPGDGSGLVFTGTQYGDGAYRGQVFMAHAPLAPPTGAIVTKIAGPDEPWSGPPWMTGDPSGMNAALNIGQQVIEDMLGDLQGDDRAMAELLGGAMGAFAGAAATQVSSPQVQISPTVSALGGRPVQLGGLSTDDLIEFLLPYRRAQP